MPQSNLLELAKQGNIESIAALINRSLQPKGITVVKTAFKDGCLSILLESASVPNQQALLAFIHQRLTRLEAASIRLVRVHVRQTGEDFPAWQKEFQLTGQPLPLVAKPQPNLLKAKQGDVKAIATLINRSLQPKGITVVKTDFKDDCLSILLESASVPNQQALVTFVRQGLTRLGAASIKSAEVYGRQTGEEFPAWQKEFQLAGQSLPLVLKPQPTSLQLAQQGNVEAITTLMNRSLQPKGITVVKTALKGDCLSILLESAAEPNQQALVAFVRQGLTRLGAASIKSAKVYGQQTGDEFPAWQKEFQLGRQSLPLVVKPQPILQLAQQGNVEAIATLMNRSLQPKGITVVKTALKGDCLQVLLESTSVPNQQALVAFVRQGLTRLGAASIKSAKVHGRQTGDEFPAWQKEFEVDGNTSSSTSQIQANHPGQIIRANESAKPFVVNAHKKFWQLPSLVRFGVIGIILLVVGLNIFVVFYSNEIANINVEDRNNSNSDEQYKYILNDFIKSQLKNEEDVARGMELFKTQGGFEASKQRAIENCKSLTGGVIKEKLLQNKSNEVMSVLKISISNANLTDKERQQMNYLSSIYAAEVLAGQDVYCPETRKAQVRS